MNLLEKRDYIHNHLYQTDEQFINDVYDKLHKLISNKSTIVGYQPDRTPISKAELIERAKKAEEEIATGKYISQDDLEKDTENWKE